MRMIQPHYTALDNRLKEVLALYTPKEIQNNIRRIQSNDRLKDWRIAWMWAWYWMACTDESLKDLLREGKYYDTHIETALKKSIGHYVYP